MKCFECIYYLFGGCPVNGNRGEECTASHKSYFDMSRDELEELTEQAYKKALMDASNAYHIRMNFIKGIFEGREDNEQTVGQLQNEG